MPITIDFSEPFSGRPGGATLAASTIGIFLNGHEYMIDTDNELWSREGVDVVQQRNTSDNRDLLAVPSDVWRQQSQSWHFGAGQRNLDRDDSLPNRFDGSFGIDPWDRWKISLLNKTEQFDVFDPVEESVFLQVHNGQLVVGVGDSLYWWDDLETVESDVVATADDIISMTYDGDNIITLHASGDVFKTTASGASTLFGNMPSADFIAYVKDYLLCATGPLLQNITAGDGMDAVDIYTSPVTGFRWKGACEGLTSIFLVGGAGDRYVVHSVGISDDATTLNPAIVSAMLPDGEIGYSIGSYLGYVFIGTNKGIRMGQQAASFGTLATTLTLGSIIPTEAPVRCFEGQDRFVWYGQSSMTITDPPDDEEMPAGDNFAGLGRLDLQTFTIDDATPAYANDIWAEGQEGNNVTAVVTWNDKRVFATSGGLFAEIDEKVAIGWLTQGQVTFSVEDEKTGLYVQAKWEPLVGAIAFDAAYDGSGFIRLDIFEVQGSIRSSNVSLNGTTFTRINPRYVLKSLAGVGPELTRWEVRAIPVSGQASRWTLPIILYDELDLNDVKWNTDVLLEFDHLIDLYETKSIVNYQESGRTYTVYVKDFKWMPERLSSNGEGWQGVFAAVLQEVR